MLHSCSTLVFNPLIPYLPIQYFLPLLPHHCPLLLAVLLCLLPPFAPLTLLRFFNGMLEVFKPGALNHFTFFYPILSTLSVSRNPILTPLPLSGFFALCSDCTHFWSGILSCDATHASDSVIIFIRHGLSFSELSASSLSSLDPYSDYVGVNTSLNHSSSLLFLNVYDLPICFSPMHGRTNSFSSSPFFPLPEISSFWGTSIAITPSGTQEVLPTPTERKYSPGSSLLVSFPSMTLTCPPFYIAPDIFFAPSLALSCSWEVLQDLGSDHLPTLLSVSLCSVFRPNEHLLSFNFQKACWDDFDSHCPSAEKYSSLSLFSASALFTSLALNAAKSFIPFGCIKRPPKAWWSAELEGTVSVRRKAFASAHRSDENCQAYIFAS